MRQGKRLSLKQKLQALEAGFSLAGDGDVDWKEVDRADDCLAFCGYSKNKKKVRR